MKSKKEKTLTKLEKNGGEKPNKVIVKQEEKTWDGPLGEALRQAESSQRYAPPEAVPRTETTETGNQNPLGNPDEIKPQTQKPTVIQQPVSNEEEELSSEEIQKRSTEHSEKNNVSDKRGYNELKVKKS